MSTRARLCLLVAAALTACTKPATPPRAPRAAPPTAGGLAAAQSRPVAEALPDLERSCSGEHLDLRWVGSDAASCWNADGGSEPWPEGVETKIVPSQLTLEAGGVGYVDYGVFNGSPETVTIDLPSQGCFSSMEIAIYDEAGERVPESCGGGGGCGGSPAKITLPPGGDARHRLQVRARSSKARWDEGACTVEPAPLAPGAYLLRPTMRLGDEPPEVRLVVRPSTGTLCTDAKACVNAPAVVRSGPSDPEVVRQTYGHACELGEGLGCRLMGDLQAGEEAERSYARAEVALALACDAGHPGDCYQLGLLHDEGQPKDRGAALSAHQRAYEGFFQRCSDVNDVAACETAARIARGSILGDEALADKATKQAARTQKFLCDNGGTCPEK